MTREEIQTIIDSLITKYPKESKYYNQGKTVLGFFVGQTVKKLIEDSIVPSVDKLDMELITDLVREKLSKIVI